MIPIQLHLNMRKKCFYKHFENIRASFLSPSNEVRFCRPWSGIRLFCIYQSDFGPFFVVVKSLILPAHLHNLPRNHNWRPKRNCYYRVSSKTCSTFVFWISWLPFGLEIPSWTFVNSPFRVHFKNIQFLIIWSNLEQDIAKILQGGNFKSQIFCLLLNQELDQTWALMTTQERSWVLKNT